MVANTPVTAEWIDELLQLPAPEQQMAFLQSAHLLDAEGLSQLLDQAMRLARSDPGKARQLAAICAEAAGEASAPVIVPRATYLRAQTHAINGDFNTALELIESAAAGFAAIGEQMEALRTNIGRMNVLNELGRHVQALESGQAVLDALAQPGEPPPQARLLLALAHQNRGVCFETIGRYEDALESYALAEAHFTALEMTDRIGDISNNRGIVLVHLGRVAEALEAFGTAARIWAEAGLTLLQAQTLSNIGDAHLVLGNYTRSLNAFEQARRLFDPLDAIAHKRILLRKTADAYLALNLYPEALAAYREVNALLKDAGMADHQARASWGMGVTLLAQSQFDEAASALAEAAALFAAAGNTPMLCSVMLEQAALHDARGDWAVALHTAGQALALVSGEAWPVQHLYASMRVADLLLPDTAAAEPYLLSSQRLAEALNLPVVNYRLNSRLGHLRRLQGRDREAQVHLDLALAQIEQLRGHLAQEALRTSFLRDKTAAYEDLIKLHLSRGDSESLRQAFGVAERAKSRTLVDMLTGVITPQEAVSAVSADPALAARLGSLQADLSAAYNKFLEASGEGDLVEIRNQAARLEQEISQLRLNAVHFVDDAAATDQFAQPLPFEAIQAQLPPDLMLVAYHIVGEEILAFLHWQGELQVVRQLTRTATVQELLQRLNAQWDRFRAGADFAQRHMVVLEQSARRLLASLYTELMAPLDAWLKPRAQRAPLAIVPHGILHNVPFHALFDGQDYLLDRCEVSYAPSATVLALCQQRSALRAHAPNRALITGVADALIPAALAEVQSVARQLADSGIEAETLTDEGATLEALNARAPACDILHLACHGLFRADNPMFSAVKLHDGWLTAADVMQLNLKDSLVTLSACESGRNTVLLGDEVIGLPRAFLGAGAASVVVSLWLVQDETTVTLMTHWYRQLCERMGRAAALRVAQQALRERYPHPYYWAPFVLIGQR
ncbi:MAG TPA: CHAT domain-containing protein [Anaerolineales bacterium]|nr:CHAT domain-containing protein [Anaerolineales bacterium]